MEWQHRIRTPILKEPRTEKPAHRAVTRERSLGAEVEEAGCRGHPPAEGGLVAALDAGTTLTANPCP